MAHRDMKLRMRTWRGLEPYRRHTPNNLLGSWSRRDHGGLHMQVQCKGLTSIEQRTYDSPRPGFEDTRHNKELDFDHNQRSLSYPCVRPIHNAVAVCRRSLYTIPNKQCEAGRNPPHPQRQKVPMPIMTMSSPGTLSLRSPWSPGMDCRLDRDG